MAGLVDTFARRTAVTQPTRFNSAVGSSAAGDDGGGFWDGLKGIGDALGGITGQQGSGRSANGNSTSGGSAYAGSPNSMNTGPAPSIPTRTYTRNNADQIMPALFDANNTLALNNARIDGNIAMLMNNQAARNAGFANSEQAYKNQLAGQIANANLDIQGFDIQQANYPQWYKFLAEKWGNAMTAGKADLDFIAKQQVNSADQRLIDWREIQQGKKEVEQQSGVARREATSAAVVGGVIQNASRTTATSTRPAATRCTASTSLTRSPGSPRSSAVRSCRTAAVSSSPTSPTSTSTRARVRPSCASVNSFSASKRRRPACSPACCRTR
jgi:hypothetical protein